MAGDFRLGIFFSLLLPARRCAALRRRRCTYQHRTPYLRLEDSRSPATGNGVAAAAPPADHAVHCVEANVANRLRRLDSVDGGICVWCPGNISSDPCSLKAEWTREHGGHDRVLACSTGLCGESESDLLAIDGDGRVPVSGVFHLGSGLLRRVRAGQRESAHKVRAVCGGSLFDTIRRMVSGSGVDPCSSDCRLLPAKSVRGWDDCIVGSTVTASASEVCITRRIRSVALDRVQRRRLPESAGICERTL